MLLLLTLLFIAVPVIILFLLPENQSTLLITKRLLKLAFLCLISYLLTENIPVAMLTQFIEKV